MFERFKHRSLDLERLDTGDYTETEYGRWHREMRFIHGVFGEVRALKHTLIRDLHASGARPASVVGVGCGSGNLLREIERLTRPAVVTKLVGVELDHVGARASASASIRTVTADGLRLPFRNSEFDFAYCTLLLHHLDDQDAVRLIREMNRVAACIYIVDLNRDPVAYHLFRIAGRLLLQPLTRDDGALSILRSRTPEELLALATEAQLPGATIVRSKVNRLVLSGGRK